MESPLRAFPLSPTRSAPDVSVQGLVARFNTLQVNDRDEEAQRQIKRLEAALRRAEIAREEAESEAKALRRDIKEMQEERQKDKGSAQERCDEYEKKYEKAKNAFRTQKLKHEEATKKASKEFMESEKRHWRAQAAFEEEMEWERKLRADAYELVAFMEVERRFLLPDETIELKTPRVMLEEEPRCRGVTPNYHPTPEPEERPVVTPRAARQFEAETAETVQQEQSHARLASPTEITEPERETDAGETTEAMDIEPTPAPTTTSTPEPQPASTSPAPATAPAVLSAPTEPTAEDNDCAISEDDGQPLQFEHQDLKTPLKRSITVPVHFGDDKENQTPRPVDHSASSNTTPFKGLGTPIIDRAAALAAIQYRRGRARSFANQQTPKRLGLLDSRRDISAPPLVTMSVGRKK